LSLIRPMHQRARRLVPARSQRFPNRGCLLCSPRLFVVRPCIEAFARDGESHNRFFLKSPISPAAVAGCPELGSAAAAGLFLVRKHRRLKKSYVFRDVPEYHHFSRRVSGKSWRPREPATGLPVRFIAASNLVRQRRWACDSRWRFFDAYVALTAWPASARRCYGTIHSTVGCLSFATVRPRP
jgi:hypothetical protein